MDTGQLRRSRRVVTLAVAVTSSVGIAAFALAPAMAATGAPGAARPTLSRSPIRFPRPTRTLIPTPAPTASSPSVAPTGPTVPPTGPGPTGSVPVSASPTPTPGQGLGAGVTSADLFVAPAGSDSNAGTMAAPFATLGKAVSVVRPGQTIAMRGGTYKPTAEVHINTSGTATQRITLSNWNGEHVLIDATGVPSSDWPIAQQSNFWTVQGLEIENANNHPYVCTSCQDDVFQHLSIHDNQETGLALRSDGTVDNQILDSDFWNNHDDVTNGQNADGIAIKFGSGTGNVVDGVRVFDNSDDGIDLWEFTSPVTIRNSWSYGNGFNRWNIASFEGNGNGFKLGGGNPAPAVAHVVQNCAAWGNNSNGFTENSNPGSISVGHSTAFGNGSTGFFFSTSTSTLTNNLSLSNGKTVSAGSGVIASGNSWQSNAFTPADLASTDPTVAQGVRQDDGALPVTNYLVNTKDASVGASMAAV